MIWVISRQNENVIRHLDLNYLLPESLWQTLNSCKAHPSL